MKRVSRYDTNIDMALSYFEADDFKVFAQKKVWRAVLSPASLDLALADAKQFLLVG